MIRIGVKYCGGCDPVYDRVKRVEKIAKSLKHYVKLVSYREPPYKILLVINGCHKQCAELEEIPNIGAEVITIYDEADWLENELLARVKMGK